ncbi:MAG: aminotransferase class V-fold PLP-dependent enzyme, partial [Calditrichia bacterium]
MSTIANVAPPASKELQKKVPFNVEKVRKDFPILQRTVHGCPLVYLDNAATTQKPQVVIDALTEYYQQENSNIHRGVYYLSQLATNAYEKARQTVQQFLNARSANEIVFLRGATEAINLVAASLGRLNFREGDEVVITQMEHHSNIVPWQILREEKGICLKVIPIDDNGEIIVEEFEKLLSEKTKLVSLVYVSNSLGTVNPVKQIIEMAHNRNVPVL